MFSTCPKPVYAALLFPQEEGAVFVHASLVPSGRRGDLKFEAYCDSLKLGKCTLTYSQRQILSEKNLYFNVPWPVVTATVTAIKRGDFSLFLHRICKTLGGWLQANTVN